MVIWFLRGSGLYPPPLPKMKRFAMYLRTYFLELSFMSKYKKVNCCWEDAKIKK